jgi:hypothetical protein
VPHHSTFSENRLNRFRESNILRNIFERVVMAAMAMDLEGFAVDASVIEANASPYHGKAPNELDWTEKQRQKWAMAEYLAAHEAEAAAEEDAPDDGAGGGGCFASTIELERHDGPRRLAAEPRPRTI